MVGVAVPSEDVTDGLLTCTDICGRIDGARSKSIERSKATEQTFQGRNEDKKPLQVMNYNAVYTLDNRGLLRLALHS